MDRVVVLRCPRCGKEPYRYSKPYRKGMVLHAVAFDTLDGAPPVTPFAVAQCPVDGGPLQPFLADGVRREPLTWQNPAEWGGIN